jgi:hypothetical protein
MDFIAHTLQDRLGFMVGPGPECPDWPCQAVLTFLDLPKEIKITVLNAYGRETAIQRTEVKNMTTMSFPLPARQKYQVVISPGVGAKIGTSYKLKFRLKYDVPQRSGKAR